MFNIAGNNASGYNLTNSLRFRSSASAYLSRTPASASNRKTWTWSGWVKRGALSSSTTSGLFGSSSSGLNNATALYFSNDLIQFQHYISGSVGWYVNTSAVFRDPSAWYHVILVVDTTQTTITNAVKLYVNGVQQTLNYVVTGTGYVQNQDLLVNFTNQHQIGQYFSTSYFDGYLAEVNFVDGQALTPSSFGSTDSTTGQWLPKQYTGTYGTNGFYLPFTDNSALTTSSNVGLGKDFSGNANRWTTNNISITAGTTYDSMKDVPTLTSAAVANYPVLNPLDSGAGTYADANLKLTTVSGSYNLAAATMTIPTTGKWYWEATCISSSGTNLNSYMYGIMPSTRKANAGGYVGQNASEWGYYGSNGTLWTSGAGATYGAAYTANDVIGIAFDSTAGTLTFYKNNTSQGVAATGITGEYIPAFCDGSTAGAAVFAVNFGQRPFAYTPPTGYVALNTYNLPTSTIVKGNTVMDATLYTGTGATQSITNAGAFRPDLVWMKSRSGAGVWHIIVDSNRGVNRWISSNSTNAEVSTDTTVLTSFNSNGFTVGTDPATSGNNGWNNSGASFVGWQWQAGSSTVTNTSGTISSQVRVNTTAGFSIVTWTGTGSNATVGHGLGVDPKVVISRKRNGTSDWAFWITGFTGTQFLEMNTTGAILTGATVWNSTTPTSTVFSVGSATQTNNSGGTYVAYLWSEIAGFSKFGSYTGNGSTDGTFVYLGFRPKYVMLKRTDISGDGFTILDTSRNTSNVSKAKLEANSNVAENTTYNVMDMLSNGFKLRDVDRSWNASGGTYRYMAFAENPFKNANAR